LHAFEHSPYRLPAAVDEEEADRLNAQHNAWKTLFHKNVVAPIRDDPGVQIMDLGTGSGQALDFEANGRDMGN
jgi:hypothetical protein